MLTRNIPGNFPLNVPPDHVIFSLPQTKENKSKGSNTIMTTSFALKIWSNKLIDVDMILFITMTVS